MGNELHTSSTKARHRVFNVFSSRKKAVQGDVIRGTAKQHGFIWFHIILEFLVRKINNFIGIP